MYSAEPKGEDRKLYQHILGTVGNCSVDCWLGWVVVIGLVWPSALSFVYSVALPCVLQEFPVPRCLALIEGVGTGNFDWS